MSLHVLLSNLEKSVAYIFLHIVRPLNYVVNPFFVNDIGADHLRHVFIPVEGIAMTIIDVITLISIYA